MDQAARSSMQEKIKSVAMISVL